MLERRHASCARGNPFTHPVTDHAYGISLTTFFLSTGAITEDFRKPRFRFVLLEVRMWLALAFERFIFPVLVSLKRFAAPRLDFNFGIACFSPLA